MRNLTITLTTEDGKLQVSESTGWPEGYPPSKPWLAMIMNDLKHRLDVLERNGPWKPDQSTTKPQAKPTTGYYTPADVVQNSLQPDPTEKI